MGGGGNKKNIAQVGPRSPSGLHIVALVLLMCMLKFRLLSVLLLLSASPAVLLHAEGGEIKIKALVLLGHLKYIYIYVCVQPTIALFM